MPPLFLRTMPRFLLPPDPLDTPAPISREMRKELRHHWKRSGISTGNVIAMHRPAPEGLTVAIVNAWIANRLHMARPSHWNYMLTHWAALPDCEAYRGRIEARQKGPGRPRTSPNSDIWIPLTEEMSAAFRAEMIRTNADPKRDILEARGVPHGLTRRVLYIWRYRHAKTTRRAHWEFAMARLAAMPDYGTPFSHGWPLR